MVYECTCGVIHSVPDKFDKGSGLRILDPCSFCIKTAERDAYDKGYQESEHDFKHGTAK